VHAEAVSYLTSRSELLSALFMLAAWLSLAPVRPRVGLGAACYGLALLSKEHAALFPCLLALDDWVFGGRSPLDRPRAKIYLALAGVLGLYLPLRLRVLSRAFNA